MLSVKPVGVPDDPAIVHRQLGQQAKLAHGEVECAIVSKCQPLVGPQLQFAKAKLISDGALPRGHLMILQTHRCTLARQNAKLFTKT